MLAKEELLFLGRRSELTPMAAANARHSRLAGGGREGRVLEGEQVVGFLQ